MKKLSLFMMLTLLGTIGFSQVIFQVLTPAPLANNYPMEYASPAPTGQWGNLDLNVPANSITGTLEFVATDTTSCVALTNNLTGKIAVLYRGACEFGVKALNAQNAGAIGVIIINNVATAPIVPGAGASGGSVTIPVIHIDQADGAALRSEIVAGNVTAFIGSKLGYYPDDLGSADGDVVLAQNTSTAAILAGNASEFDVVTGLWIRNYGTNTQTSSTVAVDISFGGSSVYSNSGNVPSVAQGDSVYVGLGVFSQATYPVGNYTMTYTITTPNDGDLVDNVKTSTFRLDATTFTYGNLDPTTNELVSPGGVRPATFSNDYEICLAFQDANASRVSVEGMTFSAVTNTPDLLTGETIEIRAYEWNANFADLNDPGYSLTAADLLIVRQDFFGFSGDYQDSNIYVPFSLGAGGPLNLVDNQRYLFCINTASTKLFLGFNSASLDYLTTQDTLLQPMFPSTTDGQSSLFLNGFGTDNVPGISVTLGVPTGVNDIAGENAITPYPNPTTNMVSIPMGKRNGTAMLEIVDVTGKVVLTKEVNFNNNQVLTVDVSSIDNGLYVFNMTFEDESTNNFNVVINR